MTPIDRTIHRQGGYAIYNTLTKGFVNIRQTADNEYRLFVGLHMSTKAYLHALVERLDPKNHAWLHYGNHPSPSTIDIRDYLVVIPVYCSILIQIQNDIHP